MNDALDEPTQPPTATPAFTPVAVRYRHDGWTPARQIAFIQALAETACVEEACRAVGMSVQSAYALRRRPDGALFRDAWEAAVDYGFHRLEEAALRRAIDGVPRPVFYHGEQVGEWRHYDERLTHWLLRYRRPARYGAWREQQPAPPPDDAHAETDHLNWLLGEMEECAGGALDPATEISGDGDDA